MNDRIKRGHSAAPVQSGPVDDVFAAPARRPEVISFAVGAPDPTPLPGALVASLAQDTIRKYGDSVLQYGMTRGFTPLLERAQELLRERYIVSCSKRAIDERVYGS